MIGPTGTVDSAGGRPRLTGTVLHRSVFFSGVHAHGSPIVEFTAILGRRRIVPVAVEPIQSSTLLSAVTVTKKCLPSGAHSGRPKPGPAGNTMDLLRPSETRTNARCKNRCGLC